MGYEDVDNCHHIGVQEDHWRFGILMEVYRKCRGTRPASYRIEWHAHIETSLPSSYTIRKDMLFEVTVYIAQYD